MKDYSSFNIEKSHTEGIDEIIQKFNKGIYSRIYYEELYLILISSSPIDILFKSFLNSFLTCKNKISETIYLQELELGLLSEFIKDDKIPENETDNLFVQFLRKAVFFSNGLKQYCKALYQFINIRNIPREQDEEDNKRNPLEEKENPEQLIYNFNFAKFI